MLSHPPSVEELPPDPQRLVVEHYPLARSVAARVHRTLSPAVDLDDLVSLAVMGLLDACARFDAARGVPFRTYAKHRMHGAILDGLRASDWVPRSARRRAHEVEAASRDLRNQLGRDPSTEEIAARLELELEAVLAARQADLRPLVSLDGGSAEEGAPRPADLAPSLDEPPDLAYERQEARRLAVRALGELPPRERLAIEMFYLDGIPLKTVGQALGVSESRACQLCRQGTQRLRKTMAPMVS